MHDMCVVSCTRYCVVTCITLLNNLLLGDSLANDAISALTAPTGSRNRPTSAPLNGDGGPLKSILKQTQASSKRETNQRPYLPGEAPRFASKIKGSGSSSQASSANLNKQTSKLSRQKSSFHAAPPAAAAAAAAASSARPIGPNGGSRLAASNSRVFVDATIAEGQEMDAIRVR